jgi:carboxyl-terminal processing protease
VAWCRISSFPSLYDPEKIGESSLDHALDWDQINPVRHRRYSNVDALVPQLAELFDDRSRSNPEFRYLQDQIAVADTNRDITSVSLNEAVRRAEREEREARTLAIENRRRDALGLDPIASLDELGSDDSDDGVDSTGGDSDAVAAVDEGPADAEAAEAGDDAPISADELARDDVLLSEAGHILVDALLLQEQAYALRAPQQKD